MHQVSTLSCCTIIPTNVSGTRLGCSCSITSVDAAARSASAARSAFPASAIAADNLERRTIREIAMLADLAKSAVAAQSSARTTSTSVFGRLSNFYYLKKGGEDRRTAYYYPIVLKRKTTSRRSFSNSIISFGQPTVALATASRRFLRHQPSRPIAASPVAKKIL